MTIHAGWGMDLPINDDEIKRAAISVAASGDNTLVAAVSGLKIKVLGLVMYAAGDVLARLESAAGGTALTGVIRMAGAGVGLGNDSIILPMAPPGYHWVETVAGQLLNLELGGAVQVSGFIVYQLSA